MSTMTRRTLLAAFGGLAAAASLGIGDAKARLPDLPADAGDITDARIQDANHGRAYGPHFRGHEPHLPAVRHPFRRRFFRPRRRGLRRFHRPHRRFFRRH